MFDFDMELDIDMELDGPSGADQRTEQWHQDRCGRITASMFYTACKMIGAPGDLYKSGPMKGMPKPVESSEARSKYMRLLAFERLTGTPKHSIDAAALRHGREFESQALDAYEMATGNITMPAPFIVHPLYNFIGASPDFLVARLGGGEIKCPKDEAVHVLTFLEGMPLEHMYQVQGGMWCTNRQWWDFCSYDPRQVPELRLYLTRVYRDDAFIAEMEGGLLQFEAELQDMVARLRRSADAMRTLIASLKDRGDET